MYIIVCPGYAGDIQLSLFVSFLLPSSFVLGIVSGIDFELESLRFNRHSKHSSTTIN